jgi:hypothetical protein
MTALTKFQEKLISDMTNEFNRLNPKQEATGKPKKFGANTLIDCIDEEKKFNQTMDAYNKTMAKKLRKGFDENIAELTKEYKKLFDVRVGYYRNNTPLLWGGANEAFNSFNHSNDIYIGILSRIKEINKCGSFNTTYYWDMDYVKIYASLTFETISISLDNGSNVSRGKLTHISYHADSYYKNEPKYKSIDELIQNTPALQRQLTYLLKPKSN